MQVRSGYVGLVVAGLLALTACTDTGPSASEPTPWISDPSTDISTLSPSETAPSSPGGTIDDPEVLEPRTELLDWEPLPGSVRDTVTRGGGWTLTVNEARTLADLEGPNSATGSGASGEGVSDALIDGDYAVVVFQDSLEQRPSRAEVTDLNTGAQFSIDGDSDLPTTTGGTWALGDGHVLHATVGRDGAYCLASVDLASKESTLGWCAPEGHGVTGARITPAGDSVMTFDDSQPSCRTVAAVTDTEIEPFPGVTACKGFEGVLIDDGAAWSVVAKDNRIESARIYARSGESYFDLGPGLSGSLVWCAGSAYFARDPQVDGEPARLLRWNADDGLTIAYESPAGQAFLAAPRCGGDTMNVTALTESGDAQVSATLG